MPPEYVIHVEGHTWVVRCLDCNQTVGELAANSTQDQLYAVTDPHTFTTHRGTAA